MAQAAPQQPIRVAASGTHLETADGKPFLLIADTCWTGPALSSESDWRDYLADRKAKGFTAVQFNLASPWRVAPTDAEGHASYMLKDGKFAIDSAFYDRAEARMKAIVEAGLLPVPVLVWAHKKGDAGFDLSEAQIIELLNYEIDRLGKYPALWILAGDARYLGAEGEKWKRIGRAVFGNRKGFVVTTHPTGENFPWGKQGWPEEKWLSLLGYQSGHGDSVSAMKWLINGPPATFVPKPVKPIVNLEPPYEGHKGYSTRKPHSALSTRRSSYWSLLVSPTAGFTYGGHGVWSWHTQPGKEPRDHAGTGIAKPWREALNLPFATQIHVLRDTFGTLPWAELRPAQQLLASQAGNADPAKFVAIAATPDRSAIIVYSPAGAEGLAAIRPEALASKTLVLVNPITGARTPTTAEKLKADAAQAVSADGDVILMASGKL